MEKIIEERVKTRERAIEEAREFAKRLRGDLGGSRRSSTVAMLEETSTSGAI